MAEETYGIRIKAHIEELQGGEEFERKLADLAYRTSKAINQPFQELYQETINNEEVTSRLSSKEQVKLKNILQGIKASFEDIQKKFEEEFEGFREEEEWHGIDKRMLTKWVGRFVKGIGDYTKEEEGLIYNLLRERKLGSSPEFKESLNVIETQLRESFENIRQQFKEFSAGLREYAKGVKEFENSTQTLFDVLQKGGWLGLAQQVSSTFIQIAQTQLELQALERTSFDLTSPISMYMQRRGYELQEDVRTRSMYGDILGKVVGGVLGSLFAGPLGAVAGASIGGSFGEGIAGLFNISERGEVQEELKQKEQILSPAYSYFAKARAFEIPATKLSVRFNENLRGIENLGYTPEEELQYKALFGEYLRDYNSQLYRDQLIASRRLGLDFNNIASFNILTRYTGEEFNLGKLETVKQFTESIYGQNDTKRIIDILESIKEISMKQLERSVDKDRALESERALTIPAMLFGIDNPYGRLGELGGKTIQTLEQLMQPNDIAHETLLFQALSGGDIRRYNERMKQGLWAGDNLRDILRFISFEGLGDENRAYWMLNAMLKNAPAGFLDPLAKLLSGESIEIQTEKGKKEIVDLDSFIKKYEEGIKKTGKSGDELLSEWLGVAKENITKFEDVNTKISNIQLEIGNKWRDLFLDVESKMGDINRKWLMSAEALKSGAEVVTEGLRLLANKLREWDIEVIPAETRRVEEIQKFNQGQERLKGESLEDYMNRTLKEGALINPGDGWGARKMSKEEQKEILYKRFKEIDGVSREEQLYDKGINFRQKAEKQLSKKLSKLGYSFKEISGFRSWDENEKLVSQGRSSRNSYHLTGMAFDIQLYDKEGKVITNEMITRNREKYKDLLKTLEDYAKENNLFWGGWFKDEKLRNREWNHFSNNDWSSTQNSRRLHRLSQLHRSSQDNVRPQDRIKDSALLNHIKDITLRGDVNKRGLTQPSQIHKSSQEINSHGIEKIIKKGREDEQNQVSVADVVNALKNVDSALREEKSKATNITIRFIDVPQHLLQPLQNSIIGIEE